MPHVRLVGLFLFITTIFIALAAAVTQTTHIRFKRPDHIVAAEQAQQAQPGQGPLTQVDPVLPNPTPQSAIQFRDVPILYPLVVVGCISLLLWFLPASTTLSPPRTRRRTRRRK